MRPAAGFLLVLAAAIACRDGKAERAAVVDTLPDSRIVPGWKDISPTHDEFELASLDSISRVDSNTYRVVLLEASIEDTRIWSANEIRCLDNGIFAERTTHSWGTGKHAANGGFDRPTPNEEFETGRYEPPSPAWRRRHNICEMIRSKFPKP